VTRPKTLVSYAQNHEDIVLARILEPWNRPGHWIDIGAGHPTFDSVTRLFSDFGWSGVNVEPLADEFALLSTERPNDINLNCAIGREVGQATIYVGPPDSRGTSSLIKPTLTECDTPPIIYDVQVRSLASLLEDALRPIDFIKIDVEGMEKEVISSADWRDLPAQIVVVEATKPNSVIPSHHSWEPILLEAGYSFRLFDGLNRFYSCDTTSVFRDAHTIDLWYPATIQDNYRTHLLDEKDSQIKEMNRYIESLKSHLEEKARSLGEATDRLLSLQIEFDTVKRALGSSETEKIGQQKLINDLELSLSAMRRRVESLSEQ